MRIIIWQQTFDIERRPNKINLLKNIINERINRQEKTPDRVSLLIKSLILLFQIKKDDYVYTANSYLTNSILLLRGLVKLKQ